MGIVYKARHRLLNRLVALKMFQPGRTPSPCAVRFSTEAQAIARLHHPNIVQIFEIGQANGLPFLALELAEQGTLAASQKLPYTPRASAELVEVLASSCDPARAAHYPRRLKPANVLFTRDGTPKVSDFGLAKILEEDAETPGDATRTGEPIGTPRSCLRNRPPACRVRWARPRTSTPWARCSMNARPGRLPSWPDRPGDDGEDPAGRAAGAAAAAAVDSTRPGDHLSELSAQATGAALCQRPGPGGRPAPLPERGADPCSTDAGLGTGLDVVPAPPCVDRPAGGRPPAGLHQPGLLRRSAAPGTTRVARLREQVAGLIKGGQRPWSSVTPARPSPGSWMPWARSGTSRPCTIMRWRSSVGWITPTGQWSSRRWQERTPPPLFDELRDEVLLQSILLVPQQQESVQTARQAIQAALGLTVADGPAWRHEREQLMLLDADLALRRGTRPWPWPCWTRPGGSRPGSGGSAGPIAWSGSAESGSRPGGLQPEVLPPEEAFAWFLSGVDDLHRRDLTSAVRDFDRVLTLETVSFHGAAFRRHVSSGSSGQAKPGSP